MQHSHEAPTAVAIGNNIVEARRLQDVIEGQLHASRFDHSEIFSIKLALEEALVNAMKHGNSMDPAKKIHVQYLVNPERFEVSIADEGGGFDPGRVPNCLATENLDRPCGRGLFLMRYYMTEVMFHPPGNRVSMSKVRSAVPSLNGKH